MNLLQYGGYNIVTKKIINYKAMENDFIKLIWKTKRMYHNLSYLITPTEDSNG